MIIHLSPELLDRSREFGGRVVASYAAGNKPRSQAVVVKEKPPIGGNVEVQAMARRCECAAAIALGLDPVAVLDWSDSPDRGADFQFGGYDVDVKGTDHPFAQRLIWPVSKKHLYEDHAAEVFIGAQNGRGRDFDKIMIHGFTHKDDFRARRRTAAGERGIVDGTWYMLFNELVNISILRHWGGDNLG